MFWTGKQFKLVVTWNGHLTEYVRHSCYFWHFRGCNHSYISDNQDRKLEINNLIQEAAAIYAHESKPDSKMQPLPSNTVCRVCISTVSRGSNVVIYYKLQNCYSCVAWLDFFILFIFSWCIGRSDKHRLIMFRISDKVISIQSFYLLCYFWMWNETPKCRVNQIHLSH